MFASIANWTPSLTVSDDNGKYIPGENLYFFVNYSNRTSGDSINGSDVWCNISFGSDYLDMSFNTSSMRYEYNASFADLGVKRYTQNYNVSCLGNALGFEDINFSSSFYIDLNRSFLTLSQSLNGVFDGASLVLGDLNNDSYGDFVVQGGNGSRILDIYNNNRTAIIFNETITEYNSRYGSLGLVDYDKDGDLDIGQTGETQIGATTPAVTRILKKY